MIQSFAAAAETAAICDTLRGDGVAVIRNAIAPETVERFARHFATFYQPRLLDPSYPYHHWTLGTERYHNTLEIHLDFNDPELYANPVFLRVATELLGREYVMSTFASAVAFPGARSQHLHRDQPLLFDDARYDAGLPPVKLTACIPLVPVGGDVGSTGFVLGSQGITDAMTVDKKIDEAVMVPGDIAIWDSRVFHRGMANASDQTRPILLLYYQRPWFFDYKNGNRSAILPISRANYARVPAQYRYLFDPLIRYFGFVDYDAGRNDPCPCGGPLRYKHCHGAL